MDTQMLEKIGFTNSEIKVYLKLLELGSIMTGELAKKAGVSRSKIYEVLDKLKEKGLVSYVIKENVKYFQASKADNLKDYIMQKKKDVEDQVIAVEQIVASLNKIQINNSEKQTSTVFEDDKGIKTVFNEIISTLGRGEEYYAFAASEANYTKEFSVFIRNYHRRREQKKIHVKLLSCSKIKNKVLSELGQYKFIDFRFSDEKFPTATIIFDSKVFIYTWNNPTGILIESKEISKQYKDMFLDMWARSK
jgi:sugar-specific transcriptional regulator TrmB